MCMGYSEEIKAWVCEQDRQQPDGMLAIWGQAWMHGAEEMQEGTSCLPHTPQVGASVLSGSGTANLGV